MAAESLRRESVPSPTRSKNGPSNCCGVLADPRLQDRQVESDWPGLFSAPSRSLREVFLGDPRVPDDHAGVLELNVLDGEVPSGPPPSPPVTGFFLLSFFVDVEATLSRLAALGLGGPPWRVESARARRAGHHSDRARPEWAARLAHPGFDHPQRMTS
jgi:hypothetical protein